MAKKSTTHSPTPPAPTPRERHEGTALARPQPGKMAIPGSKRAKADPKLLKQGLFGPCQKATTSPMTRKKAPSKGKKEAPKKAATKRSAAKKSQPKADPEPEL